MSKTKLIHVTGETHVGNSVVYYFVLVEYMRNKQAKKMDRLIRRFVENDMELEGNTKNTSITIFPIYLLLPSDAE